MIAHAETPKERFLFAVGLWRSLENVYFYTARTVTTESTWGCGGRRSWSQTWRKNNKKITRFMVGFLVFLKISLEHFERLDGWSVMNFVGWWVLIVPFRNFETQLGVIYGPRTWVLMDAKMQKYKSPVIWLMNSWSIFWMETTKYDQTVETMDYVSAFTPRNH